MNKMKKEIMNSKITYKNLFTSVIVLLMALALAASAVFAWFILPGNMNVSDIDLVIKGNDYLIDFSALKNGEETETHNLFCNLIPEDTITLILTIEKISTRPLLIDIDFNNITGEEIRDEDNNPTGYNMKDMFVIQAVSPLASPYINYNSYNFNQLNSLLVDSYLLDTTYVTFEFEIKFTNGFESYV